MSLNLFNHTSGMSISLAAAALVNNGTTSVTWDLSGVALPDGRYTAELPAAAATPALAQPHTLAFHKLAGDIDGDALVNFDDYFAVRDHFNTAGENYAPGDADGNGLVNFDDYFAVRDHFNGLLDPLELDFGDAPDSAAFPTTLANQAARHVISGQGLYLGASRDAEADGLASADASGDDAAGSDDEDGITIGDLERSTSVEVTLTAHVPDTAVLNGWVDFNQDGDWDDAGEQVFTDVAISDGANSLSLAVPAGATLGTTLARFRLTETGGYSYSGLAPRGDVELYRLEVTEPLPGGLVAEAESDPLAAPSLNVFQPMFLAWPALNLPLTSLLQTGATMPFSLMPQPAGRFPRRRRSWPPQPRTRSGRSRSPA
jgi:hypothetical protein